MSLRRLRRGELLALVGALGFVALMFGEWFTAAAGGVYFSRAAGPDDAVFAVDAASGWSGLGLGFVIVAAVPVLLTLAMAAFTAAGRPAAWAVTATILTTATGILAAIMLALRVSVLQPGDNGLTTLEPAACFGLVAFLLIPIGGWLALADERQDAPESAYVPPEPRPIPTT